MHRDREEKENKWNKVTSVYHLSLTSPFESDVVYHIDYEKKENDQEMQISMKITILDK
jgi:hypothetical protein